MPFSIAAILEISALLSYVAVAKPVPSTSAISGFNVTTVKDIAASIFDEIVLEESIEEYETAMILKHLEATGNISWTPAGNGRYTEIAHHAWQSGVNSLRSNHSSTQSAQTRASSIGERDYTTGLIEKYTGKVACAKSKSILIDDETMAGLIVTACDYLVGSTSTSLYPKVKKFWQSPPLTSTKNIASFMNIGVDLLSSSFGTTAEKDTTLCADALAIFQNYCQDGSGNTYGGTVTANSAISFIAAIA